MMTVKDECKILADEITELAKKDLISTWATIAGLFVGLSEVMVFHSNDYEDGDECKEIRLPVGHRAITIHKCTENEASIPSRVQH